MEEEERDCGDPSQNRVILNKHVFRYKENKTASNRIHLYMLMNSCMTNRQNRLNKMIVDAG